MAKPTPSAPPKPIKPKNLKFVRATFPYKATAEDELSFNEGDLLYILESSDKSWWRARCKGKEGLVPSNFMQSDQNNGVLVNPIHDACKRGNYELLVECLMNKVPINVQDKAGNSALHWACRGGHVDCTEKLLTYGVQLDVNATNRLGDNPLHLAATKGSKGCIELLRSTNRMDVFKLNGEGKTAYELATDPEAQATLRLWMKENETEQTDDYDHSDEDSS